MFGKVAFSQRVLRALTMEKQALKTSTKMLAGAGVLAGVHAIKNGLNKGREYKHGFAPGVAEVESFE